MSDVFVGLGSNIEPLYHLREALQALETQFGLLRCSYVYQSPAYGFEGADFLNLVVTFPSSVGAEAVDAVLSAIEHAGGRVRGAEGFMARTLDLDLLAYGACVLPELRLPREDILRYPFVLAPLAELAPEFRHPATGVVMADAWRSLASTGPALKRLGRLRDLD